MTRPKANSLRCRDDGSGSQAAEPSGSGKGGAGVWGGLEQAEGRALDKGPQLGAGFSPFLLLVPEPLLGGRQKSQRRGVR